MCDPVYTFRDAFFDANNNTFFPPLRFEYDRASNSFYVSIDVKPYHHHIVVGVGHWESFTDENGSGKRYVFLPDDELFPILRDLANELLDDIPWNVRWVTNPTPY